MAAPFLEAARYRAGLALFTASAFRPRAQPLMPDSPTPIAYWTF